MAILVMISHPFSLFSQPSVCPEYSFCLEADPDDCNQLSISINGLVGDSIGGLTFTIEVPDGLTINTIATTSSFESTSIGNHFTPFAPSALTVSNESVRIGYTAFGGIPAYVPKEECVHIGNIVFDSLEVECIDFDSLVVDFIPLFGGPLHLGPDFDSLLSCPNYTFDCPCSTDCPDDWGYALVPDPDDCGKVEVYIVNAEGLDISGFRFPINLEPGIVVDSGLTHSSFFHTDVGAHSWDEDILTVSGNQLTLQAFSPFGTPYTVGSELEYLFDIVFERQSCVSFEDSIVSLGSTSAIIVGHPISEAEFCYNDQLVSPGFTVCCEEVLLAGYIKRPYDGAECIEGFSWGFPFGDVTIDGLSHSFSTVVSTNEAGYYEVVVPPDETYRITPNYTSEFTDFCATEVNVVDVARIQQLILDSIPCFLNDYSPIAADLNLDKVIDSHDINVFIDWILQISGPPSGIWQFMPQSQYDDKFLNAICPAEQVENYDEYQDIAVGFYDETTLDFAAIKMGDVDSAYQCTECLDNSSLTGGSLAELKLTSDQSGTYEVYLQDPESFKSIEAVFIRFESNQGFIPEILFDESLIYNHGKDPRMDLFQGGFAVGWMSIENPIRGNKLSEKPLIQFRAGGLEEVADFQLVVGEMYADGELTYFHLKTDSRGLNSPALLDDEPGFKDKWVHAFPNPGGDQLKLLFSDEQGGEVAIEFWDIQGRMLKKKVLSEVRKIEQTIDTRQLPPGIYTLRFTGQTRHKTLKWIKQ